MSEFIQVLTTVNSKRTANKIANLLLIQRVASCVQVFGPIRSSYWWKGKVEHAQEWYCLAKTTLKNYPDTESVIKKAHPYGTPEILAVPVLKGNSGYLDWIRKETRNHKPQRDEATVLKAS